MRYIQFSSLLIIAATTACSLYLLFSSVEYLPTNSLRSLPESASTLRASKEHWESVIKNDGAQNAYETFKKSVPKLATTASSHAEAHAFGEALYEVAGLQGMSVCDSSFEFGCYHSFFGLAVNAEGIEALPKFDAACKKKYGDMNLPCQHGIGHGILVYTDYALVKALELCETISTLPTGGCSSGVFMEYNFHSMAENGDGSYLREKTENIYEPCDTLPEKFRASCYVEQVQWWQTEFHDDFKYIGTLCEALPVGSETYEACYHGVGNYVAASAQGEFEKIVSTCNLMSSDKSKALCHEGASWLIRGQEGKHQEAQKLCDVLEEPYRTICSRKLQN